jgi:hypothetical protein
MRACALLLALSLMACGQRHDAAAPAAPTATAQPGDANPEAPPPLPASSWQEFARQRGFESASSAEQARIWEEFRSAMRNEFAASAQTTGGIVPAPQGELSPLNIPYARQYRAGLAHGYPCTVDCSGHEAGYQWAEENGITDPDDCSGNSTSFIEGCQAYAEENTSTDSAVSE